MLGLESFVFMVIQHSAFSSSPSASAACQGPQLAAPHTACVLHAVLGGRDKIGMGLYCTPNKNSAGNLILFCFFRALISGPAPVALNLCSSFLSVTAMKH